MDRTARGRQVAAALAFLFCATTLFWRLDGVPLWRDEATTAVWGRLMAERGLLLPHAYDAREGQLLVQDDDGHDINSRLMPAMQSYLQFYVSAAGHLVLGDGTLQARLPFALVGLATLVLLYGLGRMVGGPAWLPLAFPVSAAASIYFVHAARQSRYYILVVFATVLLFLLVARYLREPGLGRRWSFHAALCAAGCLLYLGNYLSFAATWLALGLFFLVTDRPVLWRLCAASTVLATVLGIEFWLLHAEYLTEWRPGSENSFWENFRHAVSRRGADYWRWVPFVFLVPAAAWLSRRLPGTRGSIHPALLWASAAVPLVGLLVREPWLRGSGDAVFVVAGLLCLAVPAMAFYLWCRIPRPGPRARLALLAGLVITVCPLFTIAVAGRGTLPRYYYQTCPAAVVLVGLAAAGLAESRRRAAAVACFVGASLWPNLDLAAGGSDEVVLRQFALHRTYNAPLLEYLSASTRPGDTVAFYRNVKGMVVSYYLPDRRWVNQLDVDVPYNRRFRGRFPEDQFDDSPAPDWFVLWDPRGGRPKALDGRYEQVWEHSYKELRSAWKLGSPPRERAYTVYRRRPVTPPDSAPQPDSQF